MLNLLKEVIDQREGYVKLDRLIALLHIDKQELARTVGLSRDALSKSSRVTAPKTQNRLREQIEILNRVLPWTGSLAGAFAWYRSQPIPSFANKTAEELVKEGRATAVRNYLARINEGGYA